jgi:hypothetical protein
MSSHTFWARLSLRSHRRVAAVALLLALAAVQAPCLLVRVVVALRPDNAPVGASMAPVAYQIDEDCDCFQAGPTDCAEQILRWLEGLAKGIPVPEPDPECFGGVG